MGEYKKRIKCAICGNDHFNTILSFGEVPLAGFFPKKEELDDFKKYDLNILYCPNCHLIQTDSIVDGNHLFRDYRYLSSVSLQKHFNTFADYLIERFGLTSDSKVLDVGSNDGVLLKPLNDLGIPATGIDPSDNVTKIAIDKGCNVVHDFFNFETAKKYFKEGEFDLITSSNTFAHIDDIQSVVQGVHYALKKNGHFIIEVHYGKKIIDELQYDNVYHDHIYYYTLTALKYLFEMNNMTIINVDEIALHSGCIRVTVINNVIPINDKVSSFLMREHQAGINNPKYYQDFATKVEEHRKKFYELLYDLKSKGYHIAGYGASGRANMMCNCNGFDNTIIDYIIDESPERFGRYVNDIPVYNADQIDPETEYMVIFAWNYSKMIISKLIGRFNFKYIIPLPELKIVTSVEEVGGNNTL